MAAQNRPRRGDDRCGFLAVVSAARPSQERGNSRASGFAGFGFLENCLHPSDLLTSMCLPQEARSLPPSVSD